MEKVNLRELIIQHCEEQGYTFTDDNAELYGIFEECADIVWRGDPDHHRWYTNYPVVREFAGYFFRDTEMSVDGDNGRDDCGWSAPKIEKLRQVFPKQVMTTIYVKEEDL